MTKSHDVNKQADERSSVADIIPKRGFRLLME